MNIESININELKLHKKATSLVPEMNVVEWKDFKKNVKENGVRQPIHINMKNEVLDGRHRYLACRDLGIKEIKCMRHDFDEKEEMEFVRDTAIERRNLTVAQKHKVFTDTEELIKTIYEKGKRLRIEGNRKGARMTNKTALGSDEPRAKHNTADKIGEAIGTSSATVKRLNKIKREDENLYKEVVEGKKAPSTAYNELPTVKKPQPKTRIERGDTDVKTKKPRSQTSGMSPLEKSIKLQEDMPKLSDEEIKEQMFNANVITLIRHLGEVEGFIGRNDNYKEIVKTATKQDEATMKDCKEALQKIIKEIGDV